MGLFDRVWVPCPCGEELEFQSKAGECCMTSYTLPEAPREIQADIIGDAETCKKCGRLTTIQGLVTVVAWPQHGPPD